MTTIRKIDGAPGTGKTTSIFESIQQRVAGGCSYEDVLVVTFTRSARADAIGELIDVFPSAPRRDVKDRVRTFHGAALVTCLAADLIEDVGAQLIVQDATPEPYAEFCRKNMLPYDHRGGTDWQQLRSNGTADMPAGNRLFAIADWLTLTQRPPEDCANAPIGTQLDYERLTSLLDDWAAFKRDGATFENDDGEVVSLPYFEHSDYVDAAIENGLVPNGRYLYVDEFQDLSPQEYRLFKVWRESGSFDEIIVAGDPEQSIYGFREASPYFFENMPVDDATPLKKSYRVPGNIATVARGVLDDCPATDPRGFRSNDDGGTVRTIAAHTDDDLRETVLNGIFEHGTSDGKPSAFVLARANHQVSAIADALDAGGIPYRQLGKQWQLWDGDTTDAYSTLRAINDQRNVTASAVRMFLNQLPDGEERGRQLFGGVPGKWDRIPPDEVFAPNDLQKAFPESPLAIAKTLTGLSPERRDVLINAFERRAVAQHYPSDLRIGTLHSAKGLEADCVFLCDAITPRVERAYYDDESNAAEEHRLFYVGVTRATEALYIVQDHASGPVFPGFRGSIPAAKTAGDAGGGGT